MTRIIGAMLAALVALGLVGGAFVALSGSAAAGSAEGETYATVTDLHGESYNGQVEDITVSSTGYVDWEDMPDNVERVDVQMEAKPSDGGQWETVANKSFTDVPSDGEGDYSYDRVSGSVINGTSMSADQFSASGEGNTTKQWFLVRVTVTVVSPDGATCQIQDVHKVTTEVSNLTDPHVTGDTSIGGNISMDDAPPDCDVC